MSTVVEPARQERSDHAAALILGRQLAAIESNLSGALVGADPECLHDFRVAIRRTRAVQRQLKSVFPKGPLVRFRADFRWLQRATGDARDLDVYVLQFDRFRDKLPEPIRPDLDPLLAVLREHRARAHEESVDAISSERTRELLSDWREFVGELGSSTQPAGPRADEPVAKVAGERIAKLYRRIAKSGAAIAASTPSVDYHELRKKGKELRYLLELFGRPLYPTDAVKPLIKRLKALQDTLGRHQDREVQISTLRSLAEPVGAMPDGALSLIATGMLIERMQEDMRIAREEFGVRFAEFATRSRHKLVKDTFAS